MSNDVLDTMNMLAEKENDSDLSVFADMAPPPNGWDGEAKKTPPPPPEPPPCRLECSSCGYIAPEPEFRKNHPYCKVGIAMWIVFGGVVLWAAGMITFMVVQLFNAS